MEAANFNAYSKYYDLLYQDKPYFAEVDYIEALICQHIPTAQSIVDLGAGTGQHAALLHQRGYQVHGIERSAEMVAIATAHAATGLTFQIGELSTFQANQLFDVATSLFHVVSYLTDNATLLSAFKNINKHLKANGHFIFDVWHSPAVYHQQPETRIKRIEDQEVYITRIAEPVMYPQRNVVDVNYEIAVENKHTKVLTKLNETHPMRHFSAPEIDLLAQLTGFKVLATEAFLSGAAPSVDTWGVCYILQKIAHA